MLCSMVGRLTSLQYFSSELYLTLKINNHSFHSFCCTKCAKSFVILTQHEDINYYNSINKMLLRRKNKINNYKFNIAELLPTSYKNLFILLSESF